MPGRPSPPGAAAPVEVFIRLVAGDAHRAVERLAAEVSGLGETRLVHACPRCGSGEHGRPWVLTGKARISVSLSRPTAAGPAVVAVCPTHPVGIDLEAVGSADFAGFAAVAQHPDEVCRSPAERVRLWVRKEALVKAHGVGLDLDPRTIRLAADGEVLAGPAGAVVDVSLGPDLTCAVAVATTTGPVRIVRC